MNIPFNIITSVALLMISGYVIRRLRGSFLSWSVFAVCGGLAGYILSLSFGWSAEFHERLAYFRMAHISIGPLIMGALLYAAGVTDTTLRLKQRRQFWGFVALFALIAVFCASPFIVESVGSDGRPVYGAAHMVFPVASLVGVLGFVSIFLAGYSVARKKRDGYAQFEIAFCGGSILLLAISIVTTNVVLTHAFGIHALAPYGPGVSTLVWLIAQVVFLTRGVDLLVIHRSLRCKDAAERAAGQRSEGLQISEGAHAMMAGVHQMEKAFQSEEIRPMQIRAGDAAIEMSPVDSSGLAVQDRRPLYSERLADAQFVKLPKAWFEDFLGEYARMENRFIESELRQLKKPAVGRSHFGTTLLQARALRKEFGMSAVRDFIRDMHDTR